MNESSQLVSENLLRAVELCALPAVHFVYLLKGQECKHSDALENVGIRYVSPVLIEIVGSGLCGVKPYSARLRLTHLLALGVEEQVDGHSVSVLAKLTADKLCSAEHIRPLVVAAELHITAKRLVEMIEVIGLHYHIVEFKEGQTLFHSLLVALSAEHPVDREASSNVAQYLNVVKIKKPIGIVDHNSLSLREIYKSAHLLLEASAVMLNGFLGHHLAHIGTSRGVTYHSSSAADKSDRLVSRHLKTLHKAERHKVTNVQTVCRGVKADIENGFSVVYHFLYFFFVRYLSDKTSGNELVVNSHFSKTSLKY